jgi:hypothetical protein
MSIFAGNMSIFAGKMSIYAGHFSHVSTLMTWKPGAGPRAADPTSEEGGRRAEGAEHPPFIDVFPSKKWRMPWEKHLLYINLYRS